MKQLLLALPLLLWTADILRAQQPEGPVVVREPIVVLVRRGTFAGKWKEYKVEARTAFVGQILTCRCEPAQDGWKLAVSAQFIPVMYVPGPTHVLHERDHIDDIERSLRTYVADLQALRFDSAGRCRWKAAEYAGRFTWTMDQFKIESNVRRHRVDGSSPPLMAESGGSSPQ